jgi:hypothetical protein
MSEIVDARGLNCPEPVILTKRAMDIGEVERLVTIVDRTAALANELLSITMDRNNIFTAGFLMKVVNVLGDYAMYITLLFHAGQHQVGFTGLYCGKIKVLAIKSVEFLRVMAEEINIYNAHNAVFT